MRRTLRVAFSGGLYSLMAAPLLLLLSACGGGGGGGTGNGSTPGTPSSDFPVLVRGTGFDFPALTLPESESPGAGQVKGKVLAAGGVPQADLIVELLDARTETPQALAQSRTDAQGRFSLAVPAGAPGGMDLQLRVRLAGGLQLRAHAAGSVELSPASELVVRELGRLRLAGRLGTRSLQVEELDRVTRAAAQAWRRFAWQAPAAEATETLRTALWHQPQWNDLLKRLDGSTATLGAADVGGLQPDAAATWRTQASDNGGAQRSLLLSFSCIGFNQCGYGVATELGNQDSYRLLGDRIELIVGTGNEAVGTSLLAVTRAIGAIPLLEFGAPAGSTVVLNRAELTSPDLPGLLAAVRITRHVWPIEGRADGSFQQRVVHDYEIAWKDSGGSPQVDRLVREERVFVLGQGRVEFARLIVQREGGVVRSETRTLAGVSERSGADPNPSRVLPFAGLADIVSRGLWHFHAVHAPNAESIWVAPAQAELLELDAATLATRRSVPLPSPALRLAVSEDGSRLAAVLQNGMLQVRRVSDAQLLSEVAIPGAAVNQGAAGFPGLAFDPNNVRRVLLTQLVSELGASPVVVLFEDGQVIDQRSPVGLFSWGGVSGVRQFAWSRIRPGQILTNNGLSPNTLNRLEWTSEGWLPVSQWARVDSVGLDDRGGVLLSRNDGNVVDALDYRPLTQLAQGARQCERHDADLASCQLGSGFTVGLWSLQSNARMLGTYVPAISLSTVPAECAEVSRDVSAGVFTDLSVEALPGARLLGRSLARGSLGERCALHVWTLRGAGRSP